jgi:hypothetical protein
LYLKIPDFAKVLISTNWIFSVKSGSENNKSVISPNVISPTTINYYHLNIYIQKSIFKDKFGKMEKAYNYIKEHFLLNNYMHKMAINVSKL